MKTIKYIIISIILFTGVQSYSQSNTTKTSTIKVSGNCGMCKTRIEKAAKIDGVSKAEWSSKTKILTINYNPVKVTTDSIQKKVAAVGHDTEKYKAEKKAYDALHGCCKYR